MTPEAEIDVVQEWLDDVKAGGDLNAPSTDIEEMLTELRAWRRLASWIDPGTDYQQRLTETQRDRDAWRRNYAGMKADRDGWKRTAARRQQELDELRDAYNTLDQENAEHQAEIDRQVAEIRTLKVLVYESPDATTPIPPPPARGNATRIKQLEDAVRYLQRRMGVTETV